MNTELSSEAIETVKATRPAMAEHGTAIAERLYERLFTDPRIEALFAKAAPGRAERFGAALVAYADHIDDLDQLLPVVRSIAHKHVAAGVRPEHYDVLGRELLASIVDVLGEIDARVIYAWGEAYDQLAAVFTSVEADLIAATSH